MDFSLVYKRLECIDLKEKNRKQKKNSLLFIIKILYLLWLLSTFILGFFSPGSFTSSGFSEQSLIKKSIKN